MKRMMEKALPLLAVCLLGFLCCEAAMPKLLIKNGAAASAPGYDGVLRLHIVANSDSQDDQHVKLLVRDALLQAFAPAATLKEAEQLLLLEGSGVLEAVEGVLREEGCAYGAQLRFGNMEFPARTYKDVLYPAGTYQALRVELGDAAGENWWCVLFPPVCLLDIGVQDIENSDALVFESDLVQFFKALKKE